MPKAPFFDQSDARRKEIKKVLDKKNIIPQVGDLFAQYATTTDEDKTMIIKLLEEAIGEDVIKKDGNEFFSGPSWQWDAQRNCPILTPDTEEDDLFFEHINPQYLTDTLIGLGIINFKIEEDSKTPRVFILNNLNVNQVRELTRNRQDILEYLTMITSKTCEREKVNWKWMNNKLFVPPEFNDRPPIVAPMLSIPTRERRNVGEEIRNKLSEERINARVTRIEYLLGHTYALLDYKMEQLMSKAHNAKRSKAIVEEIKAEDLPRPPTKKS